jgi:hypothetical protein
VIYFIVYIVPDEDRMYHANISLNIIVLESRSCDCQMYHSISKVMYVALMQSMLYLLFLDFDYVRFQ